MYANPKKASAIEELLGGPIEQKLALAAEASPVNHVRSSSPPFLIIHGALDELVPLEQSRELQRRLIQAHVASRLVVVPGKGHWFLLDESEVAEVARFFQIHFAGSRSFQARSKERDGPHRELTGKLRADRPPAESHDCLAGKPSSQLFRRVGC
jgi:acetyl esterase/lipase